jgi:hypothetical protein
MVYIRSPWTNIQFAEQVLVKNSNAKFHRNPLNQEVKVASNTEQNTTRPVYFENTKSYIKETGRLTCIQFIKNQSISND